jgi:peptidoglycan/xylan/chitin deacetylase (PgdA/CDA1 family)
VLIVEQTNRIIKLLISVGWFISESVCRSAMRLFGRKPKAICTIVYYHSIPDSQKQTFVHQMNIVKRLTIPISIENVPQLLLGERYSAITFDDGFEDFFSNALPTLEQRGIPATVFLCADYLGKLATWWPETATESQQRIGRLENWRQLSTDFINIGSHTMTHSYLSLLDETESRSEIRKSRVMLQELLERKIDTFSFPYGDFNTDLIHLCRDAGYKHILTSLPANAFQNPNEFVSGRIKTDPTDWPIEFRLKLLGAYRWLPFAIYWKRRILSFSMIQKTPSKKRVEREG